MTNFSFGWTDGQTERGNNYIPELSLESAGIKIIKETQIWIVPQNSLRIVHGDQICGRAISRTAL